MKALFGLVFIAFFTNFITSQLACQIHNQCSFTHQLQYVDCLAHKQYPVKLQQGHVRILVVPHADDQHAQCLMAATYRVLQDQAVDRVILMLPADQNDFYGIALPFCYEDNLIFKNVPVDRQVITRLAQHHLFHWYQPGVNGNAIIALHCKFCDFYVKNVKIVPLLVGHLALKDISEVADLISLFSDHRTVVILSADIRRHRQCAQVSPFQCSKNVSIYEQDAPCVQALQSFSYEEMCRICPEVGECPIFSILGHLFHHDTFKHRLSYFVGYATSLQEAKVGIEDVASYAGFIFQEHGVCAKNLIGAYEQKQLLELAREQLENLFHPCCNRMPHMFSYEMLRPHGLFASLYVMSDHGILLRGCMGRIKTQVPLAELVCQMIEQAATKDVRFYPIRPKELHNTIISLSLLTEMKQVEGAHQVGEFDGIMLQYDDKEAVSLPFKYPTFGWSAEMALTKLSYQMGKASLVWKKPRARIFTFQPLVFQEE